MCFKIWSKVSVSGTRVRCTIPSRNEHAPQGLACLESRTKIGESIRHHPRLTLMRRWLHVSGLASCPPCGRGGVRVPTLHWLIVSLRIIWVLFFAYACWCVLILLALLLSFLFLILASTYTKFKSLVLDYPTYYVSWGVDYNVLLFVRFVNPRLFLSFLKAHSH